MTRDILLHSYIALFEVEHLLKNDTINYWFLMTTFAILEMAICKSKQPPHNDMRNLYSATIKRKFCTTHSMTTIYTIYIFPFNLSPKYFVIHIVKKVDYLDYFSSKTLFCPFRKHSLHLHGKLYS